MGHECLEQGRLQGQYRRRDPVGYVVHFDNLPFSFPPLPSHPMPRRHSAPLPDFIPPQLAQLADSAPEGDAWLHEVKIDGYRVAARITRGRVQMLTRHGNDWTGTFRPIAAILASCRSRQLISMVKSPC